MQSVNESQLLSVSGGHPLVVAGIAATAYKSYKSYKVMKKVGDRSGATQRAEQRRNVEKIDRDNGFSNRG